MSTSVPKIDPNHETMKPSALLPADNELLDLTLPAHQRLDGVTYPAVLDIDVEDRSDVGKLCHQRLFEPSKYTVAENVVEACNDDMKNESAQDLNKSKEEETSETKATA